jgi:hypothetical protein
MLVWLEATQGKFWLRISAWLTTLQDTRNLRRFSLAAVHVPHHFQTTAFNETNMVSPLSPSVHSSLETRAIIVHKPTGRDALILSAWAQGYMVGSIIVMIAITIANMRRGVLLHKLILIEVSSAL